MKKCDFMGHERRKSIIKAISEIEVALNTFYDEQGFDDLQEILNQLEEYKKEFI